MNGLDRSLRIPAADPLNLAGILTPGPRISPLSGQVVDLLPVSDTETVRALASA